jgi:hypothetical protein
VIVQQDTALGILAGGGTVLAIPSRDEYYLVYHRFKMPGGDGTHRGTCSMRLGLIGTAPAVAVARRCRPHCSARYRASLALPVELIWRRRSRRPVGRPPIDADTRALSRRMWTENPLWDEDGVAAPWTGPRLTRSYDQSQYSETPARRRHAGPFAVAINVDEATWRKNCYFKNCYLSIRNGGSYGCQFPEFDAARACRLPSDRLRQLDWSWYVRRQWWNNPRQRRRDRSGWKHRISRQRGRRSWNWRKPRLDRCRRRKQMHDQPKHVCNRRRLHCERLPRADSVGSGLLLFAVWFLHGQGHHR